MFRTNNYLSLEEPHLRSEGGGGGRVMGVSGRQRPSHKPTKAWIQLWTRRTPACSGSLSTLYWAGAVVNMCPGSLYRPAR